MNKTFLVATVVTFSLGFFLSNVSANLPQPKQDVFKLSTNESSLLAFDLTVQDTTSLIDEKVGYQEKLAIEMLGLASVKKSDQIGYYHSNEPLSLVVSQADIDTVSNVKTPNRAEPLSGHNFKNESNVASTILATKPVESISRIKKLKTKLIIPAKDNKVVAQKQAKFKKNRALAKAKKAKQIKIDKIALSKKKRLSNSLKEKKQKVKRALVKKKVKKTRKNKDKIFNLAKLNRIYHKVLARKIIPKKALLDSFRFYDKNYLQKGLSRKHIAIADYTKISTRRRLHMVSLQNGSVRSFFVSHGKNSGPYGGRVLSTSNKIGSNKTSEGFFKVGFREGITQKKRYRYLTVQGLERSNRRVGWPTRLGGRDIVIHTAKYASTGGRSEGCFAISPKDKKAVFSRIKGSLFYSYAG